jgi:hypothetical protein
MEKISSIAGLKNAIQVLEVQQRIKGHELKEQISLIYESLKPVNLIRNTLKDLFSSQYTTENISGAAMGAVSGLILKNILIGKSGNAFKRLLGSILQMGISKIISQNSEIIKSFIQSVFQYFFHKKNEFQ